MRIKLLLAVAFCAVMCGSAVADPVMPSGWSCAGYTAQTCGFAADWVSGVNPGSLIPPAVPGTDYRAGAVMFRIDNVTGNFEVWLSNISDLDTMNAAHLLTAVIFDIGDGVNEDANAVTLTKINSGTGAAVLASDASISNAANCSSGNCVGATDVGSEWAYKQLTSNYPNGPGAINDPANSGGPHYAISSTGIDIFGPDDRFLTAKGSLDSPDSPDGPQFGIASVGDDPATGAKGNILGVPVIKPGAVNGGVIFRFTFTGNLDVSKINNVLFQYGTSITEGFTWPDCVVAQPGDAINARGGEGCTTDCVDCGGNQVPEPASLVLLGSGFIGLAGFLRRKLL